MQNTESRIYNIIRRIVRVVAYFVAIFLALFFLIKVTLSLSPVQNKLRNYATKIIEEQSLYSARIGSFYLGFPKKIHLEQILFTDSTDSVLVLDEISANIRLIPLLNHRIIVRKLELIGLQTDIDQLLSSFLLNENETVNKKNKQAKNNSFEFILRQLQLENCNIAYSDTGENGFKLLLDLGKAKITSCDLDFNTQLKAANTEIKNSNVSLTFPVSLAVEDTIKKNSALVPILLSSLKLRNVHFSYADTATGLVFSIGSGNLDANDFLLDIPKASIDLSNGNLDHTVASFTDLTDPSGIPKDNEAIENNGVSWKIAGNRLLMNNLDFNFDKSSEPNTPGVFNLNHIGISKLSARLKDFEIKDNFIFGDIRSMSLREQCGFELTELNAETQEIDSLFIIKDAKIQTPGTLTQFNLRTGSPFSPAFRITNSPVDFELISEGSNAFDFRYFFNGSDTLPLFTEKNIPFEMIAGLHGTTGRLQLNRFSFSILDSTKLRITGDSKDLFSDKIPKVNLIINELSTSLSNAQTLIPELKTDTSFNLPPYLSFDGELTSDLRQYSLTGIINSEAGSITINNFELNPGEGTVIEFELAAKLHSLTKYYSKGPENLYMQMEGEFDTDSLTYGQAELKLRIDSMLYKNQVIKQVQIDGSLNNEKVLAMIYSKNRGLDFEAEAGGNITPDKINLDILLNINDIDLQEIGLTDSTLGVNCLTELNFSREKNEIMNLSTYIKKLDFYLPDTVYNMHPVELKLFVDSLKSTLHMNSYYYNLSIDIADNIISFPAKFVKNTRRYFGTKGDTSTFKLPDFTLMGKLDYPGNFFPLLFPSWPAFEKLSVNGYHNSVADQFEFSIALPDFTLNNLKADSLFFSASGNSGKLMYHFISTIAVDDIIKGKFLIDGKLQNRELRSELRYFDSYGNRYLDLPLLVSAWSDTITFHLNDEELIFSYDTWQMDGRNKIKVAPEYIEISAFNLQSNDQLISIANTGEKIYSGLSLRLTDFALGSLESLFATDTVVSGRATADFSFTNLFSKPVIHGKLLISDMQAFAITAGTFDLKEFSWQNKRLFANLDIKDEFTDIRLKGNLDNTIGQNLLDAQLLINNFEIEQLNHLLAGKIENAKGRLNGDINFGGDLSHPIMNGGIHFHDAELGILALNNSFELGTESIRVKENTFIFDDFSITNKQQQKARLEGTLTYDPDGKAYQDLTLRTEDMVIMNSTQEDNDMLFGFLKAQTNVDISGPFSDLQVTANVSIDKSSDITYVFPDNLKLKDSRGVVEYTRYVPPAPDDTIPVEESFGLKKNILHKLNTNIELEPGSSLKLYFNESGSDYLNAILDGNIVYHINKGSDNVSGTIIIQSGELHYKVPMVSVNKYEIEPESYISISNNVYNPYLNLNTSTNVRASTEGLMSSDPKVMTFKVLLILEGELSNMKMRFDISSETRDPQVSSLIAQLTPEERSINALNLLVRGSFKMSITADEAGGTSYSDAQIDKFYSSQLNQLIGDNVHFVDLQFDVQSFKNYNTQGDLINQRNYYYNVGKSFYHDRARINYKGSLNLSSDSDAEQLNSQFVQNQLDLEVKLSKDGALKGILFRKNKYEGLMEGEIIETGGGFRLQKDFFSFGDIFGKVEEIDIVPKEQAESELPDSLRSNE